MKKHIGLFAFALAGCTNGQAAVDVTSVDEATFPAASISGPLGQQLAGQALATDTSLPLDVHGELQSLSNLGPLTAVISKDTVSGPDLSFVQHIHATVAAQDGTMAEQVLCDVDVPPDTTSFDIPRLISDATILSYLIEGKVTLHLALTGTLPGRPIVLTHTLVAHVDVAMQGSLAAKL